MAGEEKEEEHENFVLRLQSSVPHPRAVDLIYAPEVAELTPEQVVDKALSYKPFAR
jgi:hypothetical protein